MRTINAHIVHYKHKHLFIVDYKPTIIKLSSGGAVMQIVIAAEPQGMLDTIFTPSSALQSVAELQLQPLLTAWQRRKNAAHYDGKPGDYSVEFSPALPHQYECQLKYHVSCIQQSCPGTVCADTGVSFISFFVFYAACQFLHITQCIHFNCIFNERFCSRVTLTVCSMF